MDVIITAIIVGIVFSIIGFVFGRGWNVKKLATADATAKALQEQLKSTKTDYKERLAESESKTENLDAKLSKAEKELVGVREHIKAFEETKKRMEAEFKNLLNQMLEKSGATLKEKSEESIKNLLEPFNSNIKDFQKRVTAFETVNKEMRVETKQLTNALTSNVKAQGDWSEEILERILEESGLQEGRDYIIQGKGMGLESAETGSRQKPDVIIKLPEGKHVIIDSKVSLKSYMEYCNADNEQERQEAIKKFLTSVRNHINNLAEKRYQDSKGVNTLDFVMMFIPIDASFLLLMQENKDMFSVANDKGIKLVCPSTLLANLGIINSLWRLQKQNENAKEIARLGGAMYDKVHGFIENMQKVGKAIDTAKNRHEDAIKQLSTGQGSVLRQTEKLKTLGAKTIKQLPDDMLEASPNVIEIEPDD